MAVRFIRSVQVVDSHTGGHPTRVILGGLPALRGDTVKSQRDDFRARFDALRPQLLHEPRGHAAMVGAVLVPSRVADFGVFYISSYVYLEMCGHGTIGLGKTLAAIGQLPVPEAGSTSFTLETPAGVVTVGVETAGGTVARIRIDNVPCHVIERQVRVEPPGLPAIVTDTAYGGGVFAMVDAKALGWPIVPDQASDLCRKGAVIKQALNARQGLPEANKVGSVLFYEDLGPRHARHMVVLEASKFDRSPCGTGSSARLAVLHDKGRIGAGETFRAEGILGATFDLAIERATGSGANATIEPSIRGNAHLTAFSTLVVEEGDPLAGGFLCR